MNLGGRDDDARPGLPNLAPLSGVQARKPDLAAGYHFRSLSPSLANSGHTSPPSPAAASRLLSSAHPLRGGLRGGEMTIFPPLTTKSTASPGFAPISAKSGLGMITPWELPTLRIAPFTVGLGVL